MKFGVYAAAIATLSVAASSAVAQEERHTLDPVVMAAADALGMVRGADRSVDLLNTVQFRATGTATITDANGAAQSVKVAKAVVGHSYVIPAGRFDYQTVDASGKPGPRVIRVVAGDKAWDETAPGVGKSWSKEVGQRVIDVWMSPQGALRAATMAKPGEVKVSKVAGKDVIVTPAGAHTLTITLGADHRPETVATTIDGVKAVATYTGYKDWDGYDVAFPTRTLKTLDGKTVLDLTTTEFIANSYVVFPVPVELAAR